MTKVSVGAERKLTRRFQALAAHYVFEPCFARPRTGHDKGGVEGRGKGIRWEHLVPIPVGDSLAAISFDLVARLEDPPRDTLVGDEGDEFEPPGALGAGEQLGRR